jgi:uncharacterized membrane protein YeaQ/YmgE (transglycosylase-associated protein family)
VVFAREVRSGPEEGMHRGGSSRRVRTRRVGIISWILVGLLAGALGKLIMPGDDPGGIIVTTLIGMVGAIVGGLVVGLLGGSGATGFNIWSVLVATLGAVILLALYRLIVGRRAH